MKVANVYDRNSRCFKQVKWYQIRVGDIIKIVKEEHIPADVLVLKSSLSTGMCFVDTMNLDGETNLKDKLTPKITNELDEKDLLALKGFILCEKPNEILEKWDSNLNIDGLGKPLLCGFKQLLLKGCVLKNTGFIYGIVVYTGHNTKIMKNAKNPPIKISNVMRTMNNLLYSIFIFLIVLCLAFSGAYIIWQSKHGVNFYYLKLYDGKELVSPGVGVGNFFIKFLTFIVSYAHLVPISLYVALEFVKMIQSVLISKDLEMYDAATNKTATARTIDLIEELGQVEFVFSDKTGTLTKNEMEFRKCTVNGKIYGDLPHENDDKKKFTINGDYRAFDILNSNTPSEDKIKLNDFFTCIAVCNSAYVEDKPSGEFVYQSSSPDEIALLLGAAQMGYIFSKRSSSSTEFINIQNKPEIYELILEIPFDSDRKRMSVIVKPKNGGDDEYYVYSKGADAKMMDIMVLTPAVKQKINQHLDIFAKMGLRTLVMAKKPISKELALHIKSEYDRILVSTDEDKEKQLNSTFAEVEKDLEYIGSSAIEDKLQDVRKAYNLGSSGNN
jgi:phospholipid-transporting ATPase